MRGPWRWLALGLCIVAPVGGANLAPTISTDELDSPGAGCSLREAVLQANGNSIVDSACGPAGDDASVDTIALAAGATYALTMAGSEDVGNAGDLDIADNSAATDLILAGSDSTIVNASSPTDRVLHVLTGANVTITGVAIANGFAAGAPGLPSIPGGDGVGGGILNHGTLSLSNCLVEGNRAIGGDAGTGRRGGEGMGGGIASFGPLSLTDCVVRANVAAGGAAGVPASSNDTTLGGNAQGGGILSSPLVVLVRTRLVANIAEGGAGAAVLLGDSRAGSAFGGGLLPGFSLDLSESVFLGNIAKGGRGGESVGLGFDGGGAFGGALYLVGGVQTITATTISGNQAEGGAAGAGELRVADAGSGEGGGIHKFLGLLTIANSTISGNAVAGGAGSVGGGLFVSLGGVTLDSVTLTGSTGLGIVSDGAVSITNSIIALQISGSDCLSSSLSSVTSGGFNIDSDGTCNFNQTVDQAAVTAAALGLGPLADNGGINQTHAITPGLAAYNRGATGLATDQRGVLRPQWSEDDVGAFEQSRQISIVEIPTLSTTTLTVLAGLLAAVAIQVMQRRRASATAFAYGSVLLNPRPVLAGPRAHASEPERRGVLPRQPAAQRRQRPGRGSRCGRPHGQVAKALVS